MEQCLEDQQFVTLLPCLDNICIFAPSIEVMLDQIELVFNRLKEYHLKIKPKKCHFFDTSVLFLAIYYHPEDYLQTPRKMKRYWTGQSHICKGSTLLSRTCFLLLVVYTKICPDCPMFTRVGWPNFNKN